MTTTDVPTADLPQLGELLWVDPGTLVLGTNTRTAVRLDPHFVASIRDRGVREPISVRRRADGALVVRKGQRRTLAAVRVGLAGVRVLIEGTVEPDGDTAAQVERIVDQLTENRHRADLSDAEEVRAHQELLDLGLTAAQIARATRTPSKRVRATTAVAASASAAAVMARYPLTLEQAAVIAELDDGTDNGREAVKILTVTAQREPAQFAHAAQRLRDERADAVLLAARTAELVEAGVRVLPESEEHPTATLLTRLRPSATDPQGTALTAEAHTGCPGHAAQVRVVRRAWTRDGAPETVTDFSCLDPAAHDHAPRYDQPAPTSTPAAELSDAEREQRRQQMRRVRTNNQAWDSAVTVRRTWLRETLLARKTAPKDAPRYIAAVLARGGDDLTRSAGDAYRLACELLGLEPGIGYRDDRIANLAGSASPARATVIALAVLLAAGETALQRDSWRRPTAENTAHMAALQQWGYPLAPVEELVIDPTADRPTAKESDDLPAATEDVADEAAEDLDA